MWRYVYWLPGLNFIRVPSRFIMLTMLALSVLAGFGFDRIAAAAVDGRGRLLATVIVAVLLLARIFELSIRRRALRRHIAADRSLAGHAAQALRRRRSARCPSPGNLGALERQQTQAMLHATAHWQKTIHGYSGIRRPLHEQLYLELTTFPDARSLASLRTSASLISSCTPTNTAVAGATVEEQIARTPALKLEHVEGAGRVYSL